MTAYSNVNFKTKKELKTAVANGEKIGVFNPGLGGAIDANGEAVLSGPHFPKPHTWYATVTLKDGYITKVK
jgi:hypothetical protein